jgi:hypothetical protein
MWSQFICTNFTLLSEHQTENHVENINTVLRFNLNKFLIVSFPSLSITRVVKLRLQCARDTWLCWGRKDVEFLWGNLLVNLYCEERKKPKNDTAINLVGELWGSEMDKNGRGSCSLVFCGINGVKLSGSVATADVIFVSSWRGFLGDYCISTKRDAIVMST